MTASPRAHRNRWFVAAFVFQAVYAVAIAILNAADATSPVLATVLLLGFFGGLGALAWFHPKVGGIAFLFLGVCLGFFMIAGAQAGEIEWPLALASGGGPLVSGVLLLVSRR
jgi:hypothetical protein